MTNQDLIKNLQEQIDELKENAIKQRNVKTVNEEKLTFEQQELIIKNLQQTAAEIEEDWNTLSPQVKEDTIKGIYEKVGVNRDEYLKMPSIGDNSEIFANIISWAVNFTIKNYQSFNYAELKIMNLKIWPLGKRFISYKDFFEGESGIYNTEDSTKTPRKAWADADYSSKDTNGNFNNDLTGPLTPIFQEGYKTDTNYSNKVKIVYSVLNNIAPTDALFLALLRDIQLLVKNPYMIFLRQRALSFIDIIEDDITFNYTENMLDRNDDTKFLKNTKTLVQDLYDVIYKLQNTPDRTNKADVDSNKPGFIFPDGVGTVNKSPSNLIYQLDNRKLIVMVRSELLTAFKTQLYAETFNRNDVTLPQNLEIIGVNFPKWIGRNAKNNWSKRDPNTMLMLLIDPITYEEGVFFDFSAKVSTSRAYEMWHSYTEHGWLENKDGLFISFNNPKTAVAISTIITTTALGVLTLAGATPTDDELNAAILSKNPNYNKLWTTLSDITATGATVTGDGTNYTGTSDVTYSKA